MNQHLYDTRKKAKLSQKDLADAGGISQSHYQRIEAGSFAVKIDTAVKFAERLGVNVADIFPEISRVPEKYVQANLANDLGERARKSLFDTVRRASQSWNADGIDVDPDFWTVIWSFPGRASESTHISGVTMRDLGKALDERGPDGFVVFDSVTHRHAFSLADLETVSLVRSGYRNHTEAHAEIGYEGALEVLQKLSAKPKQYDVEPDTTALYAHAHGNWQLQALFEAMKERDPARVTFTAKFPSGEGAVDGTVRIARASILAVSVPLTFVSPNLRDAIEEGKAERAA